MSSLHLEKHCMSKMIDRILKLNSELPSMPIVLNIPMQDSHISYQLSIVSHHLPYDSMMSKDQSDPVAKTGNSSRERGYTTTHAHGWHDACRIVQNSTLSDSTISSTAATTTKPPPRVTTLLSNSKATDRQEEVTSLSPERFKFSDSSGSYTDVCRRIADLFPPPNCKSPDKVVG